MDLMGGGEMGGGVPVVFYTGFHILESAIQPYKMSLNYFILFF